MYKKIDIYLKNPIKEYKYQGKMVKTKRISLEYQASTNMSKTCKEAKIKFCNLHGLDPDQVHACFAD